MTKHKILFILSSIITLLVSYIAIILIFVFTGINENNDHTIQELIKMSIDIMHYSYFLLISFYVICILIELSSIYVFESHFKRLLIYESVLILITLIIVLYGYPFRIIEIFIPFSLAQFLRYRLFRNKM